MILWKLKEYLSLRTVVNIHLKLVLGLKMAINTPPQAVSRIEWSQCLGTGGYGHRDHI